MNPLPHTCTPGTPCNRCEYNAANGGTANHPSNLVRAAAPLPGPPKRGRCLHLGKLLDGPRQASCKCRYACEIGAAEYARPDGVCQVCERWEADG